MSSPFIGKSVLILEDDKDLASLLCEFLEDKGAIVFKTEDFQEALITCMERDIQFILSDFHLPAGDASSFLQTIAERLKNRPKIFVITGDLHIEESTLISWGVSGLIRKPINFRRLEKYLLSYKQEKEYYYQVLGLESVEERSLSLEVKDNEKSIQCEFCEAEEDGLVFFCEKKLKVGGKYSFGIKGGLGIDFEAIGVVELVEEEEDDSEEDGVENRFLISLSISPSYLFKWKTVLDKIHQGTDELNDFIKKANG